MKVNEQKNLKQSKQRKQLAAFITVTAIMTMMLMSMVFATEPTTTTPSLTLDFDFSTMFDWAQNILNVMMPVVYITMGVSLAFIIIRALKAAFS